MKKNQFYLFALFILSSIKASAQCTPLYDDCGALTVSAPLSGTSVTPVIGGSSTLTVTSYSWSPSTGVSPASGTGMPPTTTFSVLGCNLYALTLTALGPNIIENGDFSAGNSCFTSAYSYTPVGVDVNPQTYAVAPNLGGALMTVPYWRTYCSFTGLPQMFVGDGATAAGVVVWEEKPLPVCPGSTYQFTMNVGSWSGLDDGTVPVSDQTNLQVVINGTPIGTTGPIATACTWYPVTLNWTAPTGVTTADIQIINLNTEIWYNDFVISKISMNRTDTVITPVNISIQPQVCAAIPPGVGSAPPGEGGMIPGNYLNLYCNSCSQIFYELVNCSGMPLPSGGPYTIFSSAPTAPPPSYPYTPTGIALSSLFPAWYAASSPSAPCGIEVVGVADGTCAWGVFPTGSSYSYAGPLAPDDPSIPCDHDAFLNSLPGYKISNTTQTQAEQSITITPNPNNGFFSITGNMAGKANKAAIDITDMLGKTIYTNSVLVFNGVINTNINLGNEIANGIYLLKIKSDDINQAIKFTVSR